MKIKSTFAKHRHKTEFRQSVDFETYMHESGPVTVIYMVRYNNVEFVFGVPAEGNENRAKESAFFEIRHRDWKGTEYYYLDRSELLDWVFGFSKLAYFNINEMGEKNDKKNRVGVHGNKRKRETIKQKEPVKEAGCQTVKAG